VEVVVTHLDQMRDAGGRPRRASGAWLREYLGGLPRDRRPHVLHFCCHGGFGPRPVREGLLLLEQDPPAGRPDQQGPQDKQSASDLAMLFQGLAPDLRLVLFNACSTTDALNVEACRGVAEATVAVGVPAVIAMQFAIPVSTAAQFTGGFYGTFFKQCLKDSSPIDEAVAAARKAILTNTSLRQAHRGIPVFYLNPRAAEPFRFAPRGQGSGEGRGEGRWTRPILAAELLHLPHKAAGVEQQLP
jgi:hypothetical protein